MTPSKLLMGVGAVVLAAIAGGVAGMNPAEPVCQRPVDRWGRLTVTRAADMEHLLEDVSRAKAAASDFADAVARRPMMSDSIDAREGARTAPARARVWCETMLAARIAADHQVPLDVVRARFGAAAGDLLPGEPGGAQAETDRTSGTTSVSSVVSRPSR